MSAKWLLSRQLLARTVQTTVSLQSSAHVKCLVVSSVPSVSSAANVSTNWLYSCTGVTGGDLNDLLLGVDDLHISPMPSAKYSSPLDTHTTNIV